MSSNFNNASQNSIQGNSSSGSNESEEKPKLRTVNKEKNSAILGKYISEKFNKKYGDSIKKMGEDILNGFNFVLFNKMDTYKPKIQETFFRILMVMATLAINTNEINFKRRLLKQLIMNMSSKPIPERTDSLYSNIIVKLSNIVNQNVFSGGDPDEPKTEQMECFISQQTNEVIDNYLNPNVEFETISDEIIYKIQDSIQTHFNEPNIRLEMCDSLYDEIQGIIDLIIKAALEWGNMFELFYVLIDDATVNGFIRAISRKHPEIKTILKIDKTEYKKDQNKYLISKLTTIITFLNPLSGIVYEDIKTMPSPSAVDKMNTRIISFFDTFMSSDKKGGSGKDALAPTDFYLDNILTKIVANARGEMTKSMGKVNPDEFIEPIGVLVERSLKNIPKGNDTDLQMNRLLKHIFDCLFEMFDDKMKLHFMYCDLFNTVPTIIDKYNGRLRNQLELETSTYTTIIQKTLTNPIFSGPLPILNLSVKPKKSVIFDTTGDSQIIANRSVIDIGFTTFNSAIKQAKFQSFIQAKIIEYAKALIKPAIDNNLYAGYIKDLLISYIYRPESITQMVINRKDEIIQYSQKNEFAEVFIMYYLLKKNLYNIKTSTKSGIPFNVSSQYIQIDNTTQNYINEFNQMINQPTNQIEFTYVKKNLTGKSTKGGYSTRKRTRGGRNRKTHKQYSRTHR